MQSDIVLSALWTIGYCKESAAECPDLSTKMNLVDFSRDIHIGSIRYASSSPSPGSRHTARYESLDTNAEALIPEDGQNRI